MPEDTSTGTSPARLLPVTMPAPAALSIGDWHGRGLCTDEDPDLFFPPNGAPGTEARKICAVCTVRPQCLEYAAGADEFGIWGGLDQQERRNLNRRQRRRRHGAVPAGSAQPRRTA